jgi:hypothetical protein
MGMRLFIHPTLQESAPRAGATAVSALLSWRAQRRVYRKWMSQPRRDIVPQIHAIYLLKER